MNDDLLQMGVPTVGSTGVWVRVAQPRGRGDVLFSVLLSGYFGDVLSSALLRLLCARRLFGGSRLARLLSGARVTNGTAMAWVALVHRHSLYVASQLSSSCVTGCTAMAWVALVHSHTLYVASQLSSMSVVVGWY